MTCLGTILGRERPLVDGEHRLLKSRATSFDPLVGASVVPAGAKGRTTMGCQFGGSQQCRARLVHGLENALVAQPHRRLVGEPSAQVTTDLLGAPALEQQLADQLAQLEVGLDTPPMTTGTAHGRVTVRLERAVTPAASGVAAQLARDRRGRPPELAGNTPDTPARVAQDGDLDPLILGQVPGTDLTHREAVQWRHEPHHAALAVGLVVVTRPVVLRGPRRSDLASSATKAPPTSPATP